MQRRREMMGLQSELPSAYRKVEYIGLPVHTTDDEMPYINTLIYPEAGFEISGRFWRTAVGRRFANYFGARDIAKQQCYFVNDGSGYGSFHFWYNNTYKDISTEAGQWYDILMTDTIGRVIFPNGIVQTVDIAPSVYPEYPIFLFGRCQSGNKVGGDGQIRCANFCIKKAGAEVQNLIPCVRKSDSKPGMYDTVSKTFYTNAGTGEFIVPA